MLEQLEMQQESAYEMANSWRTWVINAVQATYETAGGIKPDVC